MMYERSRSEASEIKNSVAVHLTEYDNIWTEHDAV